MSEKRLFQCDWSRGQTDGDPVAGTVRRILNMDMSDQGMIRTRKAFAPATHSITNCSFAVKMEYSPSWSDAEAWICCLHLNSIIMIPIVNGSISNFTYMSIPDLGTDFVDLEKSQIMVTGDKVIAMIVRQGQEFGELFMISSSTGSDRFRAPHPLGGTTLDASTGETSGAWTIYKIKAQKPELYGETVSSYGFLDDDCAGDTRIAPWSGVAGEYHWPTNKTNVHGSYYSAVSSIVNNMRSSGPSAVGLVAVASFADDDQDGVHHFIESSPAGIYGRTAIIEYRVQYLYYDGQMSALSNAIRVSDWDSFTIQLSADEVYRYAVGVGLIVPTNISREIKGINIYRKSIETGNPDVDPDSEPQLIATHWLDSETLEDLEVDAGTFDLNIGDKSMSEFGYYIRYGAFMTTNIEFDLAIPYASWLDNSGKYWPFGATRRAVSSNGECRKTSGWVSVASGYAMYFDEHYGVDCAFTYRLLTSVLTLQLDTTFNCLLVSRYNGNSGVTNSLIRYGCSMPYTGIRQTSSPSRPRIVSYGRPSSISGTSVSFTMSGSGLPFDGVAAVRTYGAVDLYNDGIATGYETFGDGDTISEEKLPLVCHRDTGVAPNDSETSYIGGTTDTMIDVNPIAFSVSGGRLLGIGGKHKGAEAPSRVWYSLFQNFGFVLDANYLDYGARGDGVGVAISSFKSRILLHFTSATYIIDASGGSDMAWRELGAISGVGLLNRNAVTETPIGNVWADKNGVHIFNGRGVTEITNMPDAGISVRETYKDLIDGNHDKVRVCYKPDTHQVWISVYENALVWDTETGAWHENEVEEAVTYGTLEILGFFDIGGVQNLVALRGGGTIQFFPESGVDENVQFDWGIDIVFDAGASEVVKKTKRFYVDIMSTSASKNVDVFVSSQGGPVASQSLPVPVVTDYFAPDSESVVVFSSSTRGRKISVVIRGEGRGWTGVINGLGMSHKLKPLK